MKREEKIGRNDPCPCGSGKKYKKCHLSEPIPTRVTAQAKHFAQLEREKALLRDQGIFVNYVKPVTFQGRKVWALGTRVIFSPNPDQTFHDFVLDVLKDTLGKDWWDEQTALAQEEQHFVMKCFRGLEAWKRDHADAAEEVRPGVFSLDPDGLGRHLLSLAFDVATLRAFTKLPDEMVARLRHRDQYQGARYEFAVAGIFARIDCEVEFFGPESRGARHAEFVARFRPTGDLVAVEAKSRHRPGVIHQPREYEETAAARGDVSRLLRDALQQDPGDKAFAVFIDLNSPLTPGIDVLDKEWATDIRNMLDEYPTPTADAPDPWTLLAITNFSHHYQEGVTAASSEHVVVQPLFVRHGVSPDLANRLSAAIGNYGRVPNLDAETLLG